MNEVRENVDQKSRSFGKGASEILIVSMPGRVQESMIAQEGVSDQIRPFDNFDDAPELPLELMDTTPAVRRRPPYARMNVKTANNIGDAIAIANAVSPLRVNVRKHRPAADRV